MSDLVTDEMAETAARARWISKALDPRSGATREWCERAWDDMGGSEPSDERANEEICMRAALEAAAPTIAGTALREAADWLDDMSRGHRETAYLGAGRDLVSRLRARAERIEKEDS